MAPLWENVVLGHQAQRPTARGFWIDRKGAKKRTEEIIERFGVRTPGPDVAATALSGGNQQKLIVGREMMADPTVLLASNPTRGIDVGAQAAVWDVIKRARRNGLAVVLVSADLDELIGLSDTLLVMYGGRIVATLDPGTVTPVELGSYMTGAAESEFQNAGLFDWLVGQYPIWRHMNYESLKLAATMPNTFEYATWLAMESIDLLESKRSVSQYFNTDYSKEFKLKFPVGVHVTWGLP